MYRSIWSGVTNRIVLWPFSPNRRFIRFKVNNRDLRTICLQFFTLPAPCISESCIKIKINLNFHFHTSLWCLERFYEGLKGLNFFSLSGIGAGRVNIGSESGRRWKSKKFWWCAFHQNLKFLGLKRRQLSKTKKSTLTSAFKKFFKLLYNFALINTWES